MTDSEAEFETSTQRAERALRELTDRYRVLFESVDTGFAIIEMLLDANGRAIDYTFIDVNTAFVKQTGLNDAVGRTARALVPGLESVWVDTYARVAETGESVHFEQGSAAMGRWFEVSAVRVGLSSARQVALLFRDVSAQRAASAERDALLAAAETERARATGILEAMADAYFALDADFRIVAVNAAMERFTGFSRGLLLGRVFWDMFPATVGTDYERHYRAAVNEGASAHFTDSYDDGRLALSSEADVYPVPGGGVAVFWRNITERVQAEKERERLLSEAESARASAEAANRAKGEFLAVMSHELRTPLNAISGYAELLELGVRGPVTHEQRIDLQRIQRSQRALLSVINEVLNYARLEAGAISYILTDVAVDEAVRAAKSLVSPQLRAKGLGFSWTGCDPTLSVRADAEKLQQVLLNLLSNAVKFTGDREGQPGHLEVSCEVSADERELHDDEHPSGVVLIHVRDTGVGIPPDKCEAIFEPFVQVDQRLTRLNEGTGLGLAISRELARGMHGELTVKSTVGAGSTFTVRLPRASSDGA